MPHLADIRIRDPFILPVASEGAYYLFGTTDENVWSGPATGFDCYRSLDLESWSDPIPAFRPPHGFWATTQFWAPEVHRRDGRWWMFATFADGERRGTQVLVSDRPEGPYETWSDGPVTPTGWLCLDGTLHVDDDGDPWLVFCREWLQIADGAVYAQRMSSDLRHAVGPAELLFRASDAPWSVPLDGVTPVSHVTDGPWLRRLDDGGLALLWSSRSARGYALGLARSRGGHVLGPWVHDVDPLWDRDGGHGMVFDLLGGGSRLVLHRPNGSPWERAELHVVRETDGRLELDSPEPAAAASTRPGLTT